MEVEKFIESILAIIVKLFRITYINLKRLIDLGLLCNKNIVLNS
uniref:Uncharacterized protein n=1 Tax=Porphyridium purpureum TaxID=35688 RepID=W0S1S1_PORPP|nr:hypothetical protein Y721_p155 [Porphyridium purpureum]BAO23653.1 hypothetical protein [Porphyridium purpureum]